jgi:hypothetical protein
MTLVESTRQTLAGMQKIERAIIEAVRERNVPITAAVFSWNRGRGTLAELPDPVPMEVRVGLRQASASWPQVCLQDSCDRIDRFDVRTEIERIAEALAPAP